MADLVCEYLDSWLEDCEVCCDASLRRRDAWVAAPSNIHTVDGYRNAAAFDVSVYAQRARTLHDRSRAIAGELKWAQEAKYQKARADAWQADSEDWLEECELRDGEIKQLEDELEKTRDGVAYWRDRFVELNGDEE